MIATPDLLKPVKQWYAVHTRSRHEKKVGLLLAERQVERFVPLMQVRSQWADRTKWVEKPLFPGYIFVHISGEEIPTVNATRGVARLVCSEPYLPASIPDQEIHNIQVMLQSQVRIDPYPYLRPGQMAYIRRGPLKGVEGVIVRKAKRHFVVVSVNLIGHSVLAEVSAEAIEGL
jgi:transcription antitermination factor NusG